MKKFAPGRLAAGAWLLAAGSTFAQAPVPEKWDAAAPSAPEGLEAARRCGVGESDYLRMVGDAAPNALVMRRPNDRSRPYLVVTSKRVVCVQASAKGFPTLPQEAYEKTVDFDGMAPEQAAALKSTLSAQLAAKGVATALVKNEKGNAVQVTYMFVQAQPSRVYYQASFLRAGEFDEKLFERVFQHTGNWGLTARGQQAEQYKSLFVD